MSHSPSRIVEDSASAASEDEPEAQEACDARSDIDVPVAMEPRMPLLLAHTFAGGALSLRQDLLEWQSNLKRSSSLIQEAICLVVDIIEHGGMCHPIKRQAWDFARFAIETYTRLDDTLSKLPVPPRVDVGSISSIYLRAMLASMAKVEKAFREFAKCSRLQRSMRHIELQHRVLDETREFKYTSRQATLGFGLLDKTRRIAYPFPWTRWQQDTLTDPGLFNIMWSAATEVMNRLTFERLPGLIPDMPFHMPILAYLRDIDWTRKAHPDLNELETGLFNDDMDGISPTFSARVERELAMNRFDFPLTSDIIDWRVAALHRLIAMKQDLDLSQRGPIDEPGGSVWLVLILLDLLALKEKGAAIIIAEILTMRCRVECFRAPSAERLLEICSLFGALSLVLTYGERHAEGVRAIEHAVELLQPMYEADPARHRTLMARLRLTNASAVSSLAMHTRGLAMSLGLHRKASRLCNAAVAMLRANSPAEPSSTEAEAELANALLVLATIGKARIEAEQDTRPAHVDCEKKRREGRRAGPPDDPYMYDLGCKYRCNDDDFRYFHGRLQDSSLGTQDDLLPVIQEAVGIFERLADRSGSSHFRLSLGTALLLHASLIDENPGVGRGPDVALRTREIVQELELAYRQSFRNELGVSVVRAAVQLGASSRLEDAVDAFELAIEMNLSSRDHAMVLMRAYHVPAALRSSLAMVFVRLERYEDALQKLVEADVANRSAYDVRPGHVAEIGAIRALATWLSGDAESASVLLQRSIKMVQPGTASVVDAAYVLFLSWLGGVQCAMSSVEAAVASCREAVRLVPFVRERQEKERRNHRLSIRMFESAERLAPEAHLFLAAALTKAGRKEEALVAVEESVALAEAAPVAASLKKTALRLKARLLDGLGDVLGAGRTREEAGRLQGQGFLAQLKCC